MSNRNEAVRGTSVRLRRSLRTRVIAACAMFLVGLASVVCFVLPRAFETVARDGLRERARSLAAATAFQLSRTGDAGIEDVGRWLATENDFESVAILDDAGAARIQWPPDAAGWEDPVDRAVHYSESVDHFLALAPLDAAERGGVVAVRMSTVRLHGELASVVGLFASFVLMAGAGIFILARYLVQTVLAPLEGIQIAAERVADGEAWVTVPSSGNPDIDELGGLIAELGDGERPTRTASAPASWIGPLPGGDPSGPTRGLERRGGGRRGLPDPASE